MNTFNVIYNFLPMSLKITLFLLTLVFYITLCALFIGEDIVSQIYNTKGKDSFFGFVSRGLMGFFYSFAISFTVISLLDLFFVQEKKMKRIFVKEKKNIVNLKVQITYLTKEIFIRYVSFFIFVFVFFLLVWFYLLCFNYVYPHTQGEWIKSSIFFIILMQLLSIGVSLLQTILRYNSYALKNERIFRMSQFFG